MSNEPVVNHLGHCVADLDRSREFYVEVFGFAPWFELSPPDEPSDRLLGLSAPLGMECSYLRKGDVVLELIYYADHALSATGPRTMNQPGLTHLSFSVADIEATCRDVVDHGGTVLEDTNIGAAVFIRDPDGQLIELLPLAYRTGLPPLPT